ncbi:MAG: hypothetical protein EOO38_27035, partial [Cytophagaceae bacterium]
MRVRVQLYRAKHAPERLPIELWPRSKSQRQLFLVHVENVEDFLQEIRVMELVYAIRVKPGTPLRASEASSSSLNTTATVGLNGLRIRVDVHGNYPSHRMKSLLDLFRMFQGPLNEVCIQGFEDTKHALAIERAITKGVNTVDEYLVEQFNQLLRFQKMAIRQLCERKGNFAAVACPQGIRLY